MIFFFSPFRIKSTQQSCYLCGNWPLLFTLKTQFGCIAKSQKKNKSQTKTLWQIILIMQTGSLLLIFFFFFFPLSFLFIVFSSRRVKLIPQRCRPQPVFNLSSSFQFCFSFFFFFLFIFSLLFFLRDGSAILAITASYDPTFLAVMENVDISIDKRLMRAFGRLQTLYEIPPILAIEVMKIESFFSRQFLSLH